MPGAAFTPQLIEFAVVPLQGEKPREAVIDIEDFGAEAKAKVDGARAATATARVTSVGRESNKRSLSDSQGDSHVDDSQPSSQHWREVFGDPPDMNTDYQGTCTAALPCLAPMVCSFAAF